MGFFQTWEYISIITIILECSSIYFFTEKKIPLSSNLVLIIGFFPLALYSLLHCLASSRARTSIVTEASLYLAFVIVYSLTLGRSEFVNFAMKFLAIFPCIMICTHYLMVTGRIHIYIRKFIQVMSVLAGFSLIMWFLGPLTGVIRPNSSVSFLWGNMIRKADSYFDVYFTSQREATFINIWRNTAFFTEAPKYCLLLTIAFLFETYFFKRRKILILLGITIISTFAYTGMLGILIYYFAQYTLNVVHDIRKKTIKPRTITWPVIMGAAIIAAYFLIATKLDTSSGIGRLGDYIVCFSVGMRHPLFGYGFLDNEYLNSVLHASRLANGVGNTMGLSNSLSQVFIDGGIYLVAYYMISFAGIIKTGLIKMDHGLTAVGIVLLYLFITTYFAYTGLMFFMLSCGFFLLLKRTKRNAD